MSPIDSPLRAVSFWQGWWPWPNDRPVPSLVRRRFVSHASTEKKVLASLSMPPIDSQKRESSFLLTEKKAVCSYFVPGQARVLSMPPIDSPLEQSVSRASGERRAPPPSQECSRCRRSNRLSPISFRYQSKEENVDNFKPA
jgi:hypothetical protein